MPPATALLGSSLALAQQQQFINILTGGQSGVYYPLGVALSQIYGKAIPNAKATAQVTKASAENLNLLQAGRGEIALTLGDSLSDAWKGDEEGGVQDQARQAARPFPRTYNNVIQIVANADSGIKTLADLKGKRLSVGAAKSGTELNSARGVQGRRSELQGSGQGRIPAVRRIGRADQEPPARRDAAVGGAGCGVDPRPGDLGEDRRRLGACRHRRQDRTTRPTSPR